MAGGRKHNRSEQFSDFVDACGELLSDTGEAALEIALALLILIYKIAKIIAVFGIAGFTIWLAVQWLTG